MKNKNLFRTLILILVAVTISACCIAGKKRTTNLLDESMREWMVYKINDTLWFDTDDNQVEYFHIYSVFHDTIPRHQKFSCDIVKDEVYDVEFRKEPQSNGDYYSSSFNLNKSETRLSLGEYYCEDFHTFQLGNYQWTDLKGVNRELNDVWVRNLRSYRNDSELIVAYSKTLGLISYQYPDGKIFKRRM